MQQEVGSHFPTLSHQPNTVDIKARNFILNSFYFFIFLIQVEEIDQAEMHNFENVVPPSLNLTSYYQNYGFSDKVICPC